MKLPIDFCPVCKSKLINIDNHFHCNKTTNYRYEYFVKFYGTKLIQLQFLFDDNYFFKLINEGNNYNKINYNIISIYCDWKPIYYSEDINIDSNLSIDEFISFAKDLILFK